MRGKFLVIFVVLSLLSLSFFSLKIDINLSDQDSIIFSEIEEKPCVLPGSYFDESSSGAYWKASGIFNKTFEVDLDGVLMSLTVDNPMSFDSTVVFSDFFYKKSDTRELLMEALEKSEKFVWISIYDLDDRKLINLLEKLYEEGIEIKIILEKDNYNSRLDRLYSMGTIKFDENSKLMHDKFTIIDGAVLISGSSNFTENGFDNNSNNLNIFYSNEICSNFMEEFELQSKGLFGASSRKKISKPSKFVDVFTGNATVNSFFSASDDIKGEILKLIDTSLESLDIMMFTFTDQDISDAIIKAMERGVRVRVIAETFQASGQWSVTGVLLEKGAELVLDENPKVFHHKVMIVDGKTVATGSYNYTISAQKYNDENMLIIESPSFIDAYERCFESFWEKWNGS